MRHVLRSLALISAIAVPAAAHADTISFSYALSDSASPAYFVLTSPTGTQTVNPTLGTPVTSTITITNPDVTKTANVSDSLTLAINFINPTLASGSNTLGGPSSSDATYKITGNVNDQSTINWNPSQTTVTLSDGAVVQISVASISAGAWTPTGNNSPGTSFTANDQVTFTLISGPVTAATPEPSSLALLGTGVLGAAGMLRRRLKA